MEPESDDPALTQFVSKEEFGEMGTVFSELAKTSGSITRLPSKPYDRQRVVSAFTEAFDLIGGVPRLAMWAHVNPTEFFKLYAKLLPQSNTLDIMGKMSFTIQPALPPSPLDDLPEHMKRVERG